MEEESPKTKEARMGPFGARSSFLATFYLLLFVCRQIVGRRQMDDSRGGCTKFFLLRFLKTKVRLSYIPRHQLEFRSRRGPPIPSAQDASRLLLELRLNEQNDSYILIQEMT